MVIRVSGRHMDVTDALKTYAETKTGKLTRYYDRIQEIEVIFNNKKDSIGVEVQVNGEHKNLFIAHADGSDAYGGIDACVDKLERQLADHHKKVKNRKHPGE